MFVGSAKVTELWMTSMQAHADDHLQLKTQQHKKSCNKAVFAVTTDSLCQLTSNESHVNCPDQSSLECHFGIIPSVIS